jgi:CCR4-NOT transcription complex subunit 9
MEKGTELSKTVSTFIVQRILMDQQGLAYMCNTADRFHAISSVLVKMISQKPSSRLLKHIVRCYNRLSENHRARSILKENFPKYLKDQSFCESLDESVKKWLASFLKNLGINNGQSVSSNEIFKMNDNNLNAFNSAGNLHNSNDKKPSNKNSI